MSNDTALEQTWERKQSTTVYQGRVQIVCHDVVLPDGSDSTYDVNHGDGCGVAVIIKTPEDELLVCRQYRFPLDKWIYDLPGGWAPGDEQPEEAAIRECIEEIGIKPIKLQELGRFHSNPGRNDWGIRVYYCDQYEAATSDYDDPSEQVEMQQIPLAKIWQMVDEGEIQDPSFLIGLLRAQRRGLL